MRAVLDVVLDSLQLPRIARWRLRREAIILGYHGFVESPVHGLLGHSGKHLGAGLFRRQLAYLKRAHRILRLDELLWHCRTRTPLPPGSVVLTIDDGYRSVHSLAFPLLKEFGVPATVFLTTDFIERGTPLWTDRLDYCLEAAPAARVTIDAEEEELAIDLTTAAARIAAARRLHARLARRPPDAQIAATVALEAATGCALANAKRPPPFVTPLSWPEVADMRASGLVSIGSHTESHAILSRCSPTRRRHELEGSRAVLEARLGERCELFCYPNGTRDDYDDATMRLLRELGFACGVTTVAGANAVTCDPFELRRFVVSAREGFSGFRLKIYGVVNTLSRAKQRLRSGSRERRS
jgi:peptidoglycan/xylan/chitin deacetylase (PgdA/CDA1 family)